MSAVVEPNVFKTLFNKQEVEAALIAGVRILHLHDRTQEAIRDTHGSTGVCAGVIPGGG